MTITTLHPVDDFARAVRRALADLPADEIDDLTDGLEADLAERAADEDSPEFGDPVAYANELRSAAGLPYRRPTSSLGQVANLFSAWRRMGLNILHSNRVLAGIAGFFGSLRAVWWVYRGWTVFLWFEFGLGSGIHAIPVTLVGWLVFVPAIILSVQFGRGRWTPWLGMRVALAVINIALSIATPFIVVWVLNSALWEYL